MTTYRLKPLIVQAAQFNGEITPELKAITELKCDSHYNTFAYTGGTWSIVYKSDWVVKLAPASMVEIMSEELFDSLVEVVE